MESEKKRRDSSLIVTIRRAASGALPRAGGPRPDAGETGAWRHAESCGEAAPAVTSRPIEDEGMTIAAWRSSRRTVSSHPPLSFSLDKNWTRGMLSIHSSEAETGGGGSGRAFETTITARRGRQSGSYGPESQFQLVTINEESLSSASLSAAIRLFGLTSTSGYSRMKYTDGTFPSRIDRRRSVKGMMPSTNRRSSYLGLPHFACSGGS
jgi:hypothetical protein